MEWTLEMEAELQEKSIDGGCFVEEQSGIIEGFVGPIDPMGARGRSAEESESRSWRAIQSESAAVGLWAHRPNKQLRHSSRQAKLILCTVGSCLSVLSDRRHQFAQQERGPDVARVLRNRGCEQRISSTEKASLCA